MRRIPRSQRSIGLPKSSSQLLRSRAFPSQCQNALTPFAGFSTTPIPALVFSDKQDSKEKKKHQAFVRRWQKRLLGDSEPIGAHVDPYDGTSPIRISPEEYGEEEEVLVDENGNEITASQSLEILYRRAESGHGLRVVGGKDMVLQTEEEKMAAEFEILTLKTYTPLSLKMADEIDDLTGTPYTLKDENLMMAQMWQETTGKPYTESSFGTVTQIKDLTQLRRKFQQAIVEVYTLKQAGLNLDLNTFANRGIYNPPHWIFEVKMHSSPTGELALTYPEGRTTEKLLKKMQEVPTWDPASLWTESEPLVDEVEDMEYEQIEEQALQPETSTEPRQFAIAKVDETKRFDFMSNRPVPRAKPQEAAPQVDVVEETEAVEVVADTDAASKPSSADLEAAVQASELAVSSIRDSYFEDAAKSVEANVSTLRQAIRSNITALSSESTTTVTPEFGSEAKWRYASLANPAFKFALTKRLTQLTGIRISDPYLSSTKTLGDLYGQLCLASKPKSKKLFGQICLESEKKQSQLQTQIQTDTLPLPSKEYKKKPGMDTLLTLPNVDIRPKRLKSYHKHRQIGLDKVIKFALAERELESERKLKWPYKNAHSPRGASKVLEFGEPIPATTVRELEREREQKDKALVERREAYAA